MIPMQDPVEEGGLAGTEETGKDGTGMGCAPEVTSRSRTLMTASQEPGSSASRTVGSRGAAVSAQRLSLALIFSPSFSLIIFGISILSPLGPDAR